MDDPTRRALFELLSQLWCPACHSALDPGAGELACSGCPRRFEVSGGIPRMFVPNEWSEATSDVTDDMKAFYEQTPFPNYDEFDSVSSLMRKAREGRFAKQLDDELAPGIRVLECGCGTGQLSNFLSIANRTVVGIDMSLASLALGEAFRRKNQLDRVHFLQTNLFRPVFMPESFDVVISNGVLHHTSDPFLAFRTIARLVRPGGHILVGLYHRYGRLITDARRLWFRLTRDRLKSLDPNLRAPNLRGGAEAKQRAWFLDQYKNPHESKHTIGEVIGWLDRTGLEFVNSVPRTKPFQPFSESDRLLTPEPPGGRMERLLVELGMVRSGSREGGFFVVIGRKPA